MPYMTIKISLCMLTVTSPLISTLFIHYCHMLSATPQEHAHVLDNIIFVFFRTLEYIASHYLVIYCHLVLIFSFTSASNPSACFCFTLRLCFLSVLDGGVGWQLAFLWHLLHYGLDQQTPLS